MRWLTFLLGWLAFSEVLAQSAADLFVAGRAKMEGGVFALYSGGEQQPATLVRVDKTYTDYGLRGFFRIGLLPVEVMEGVVVEIQRPELLINSLEQLNQWLGPQAASRIELRRVRFLVSGASTNCLESTRARLAAHGRLELLDGVTFVSGTNQMRAACGLLQITGKQTGQLILETKPPVTNNLFSATTNPPKGQQLP